MCNIFLVLLYISLLVITRKSASVFRSHQSGSKLYVRRGMLCFLACLMSVAFTQKLVFSYLFVINLAASLVLRGVCFHSCCISMDVYLEEIHCLFFSLIDLEYLAVSQFICIGVKALFFSVTVILANKKTLCTTLQCMVFEHQSWLHWATS